MPFITTEQVADIRQQLKTKLPDYNFSVRKRDNTCISVALKSGKPLHKFTRVDCSTGERVVKEYDFCNKGRQVLLENADHYGENATLFKLIDHIIKNPTIGRKWHERRDSITDYYETVYFIDFQVGYNYEPYKVTSTTNKKIDIIVSCIYPEPLKGSDPPSLGDVFKLRLGKFIEEFNRDYRSSDGEETCSATTLPVISEAEMKEWQHQLDNLD